MVDGAPREWRWLRAEPRRTLAPRLLERIVQTAFPRCHVIDMQPLADGWRNANFKLWLDCAPESIVLRIYEHDASLCQKEVDVMGLLGGSVPLAEVIHAEARGWEDIPPFTLMRYVEGISFRELTRSGDTEAIAQGPAPRAKLWPPSDELPSRSRDGWLRDRTSQRPCWRVRIGFPGLLICASHRRTCNSACQRICGMTHGL